jgi:ribosomal protein L10
VQDTTLSLRLSKAESRALRDRARREGVSKATLVRRALRAYGVTPEAEPQKSGYDVIKHLLGTEQGGPSDLAHNAEHLDDYGR